MGRFGAYYPAKYSNWRAMFQEELGRVVGKGFKPTAGFLEVDLILKCRRPRSTKLAYPKPDIDNYAKAVLDACNGVLWLDDSQIISLYASKAWTPTSKCDPTVAIALTPITRRVRRASRKTT